MRMVRAELRKLARTPAAAAVTVLNLLLMAFVYRLTAVNVARGLYPRTLLDPEGALTYSLAALVPFGSMLTAVLGAVCSGQEYTCRTWGLLLTQGAGRRQVWLAKVLAVLAAVAGWMLAALAVGYIGSVWTSGRAAWPHLDARVAAQAGVVYSTLAFWALAAYAAATAGRGTAAGTAFGVGFPFAEIFLRWLPLRGWLPAWNELSLLAAAFGTGSLGIIAIPPGPYPPPAQAGALLALMTAAALAVAYTALRRSNPA